MVITELEKFKKIVERFQIDATVTEAVEHKEGNVNKTHFVTAENPQGKKIRLIVQQINTEAFKKPKLVMDNTIAVTSHIRKVAGKDATLDFICGKNGEYLQEILGGYYRACYHIPTTTEKGRKNDLTTITLKGSAYGEFLRHLQGFNATSLNETIPKFHDTPDRYRKFLEAVKKTEKENSARYKASKREIEFLMSICDLYGAITRELGSGIPNRVSHNDTKLNNVLIREDGKPIVIDLDTCMAGSSLYDFGDAIRAGAVTLDERSTDYNSVGFDKRKFYAFTAGFIRETYMILTPSEVELMPFGPLLMTAEVALRFLTDYLDGDVYFNLLDDRPESNLERCRNQIALFKSLKQNFGYMDKTIRAHQRKLSGR